MTSTWEPIKLTEALQGRREMAGDKVMTDLCNITEYLEKKWLDSGYSQVPLIPDLLHTELNYLAENLKQWEVFSSMINLGTHCYNILREVYSSANTI